MVPPEPSKFPQKMGLTPEVMGVISHFCGEFAGPGSCCALGQICQLADFVDVLLDLPLATHPFSGLASLDSLDSDLK